MRILLSSPLSPFFFLLSLFSFLSTLPFSLLLSSFLFFSDSTGWEIYFMFMGARMSGYAGSFYLLCFFV